MTQQPFTLDLLAVGDSAVISSIRGEGAMRDRLQELGFTSKAPVTCLFPAVFGDPRAYRIKNTLIALRNADAKLIECRFKEGEK